MILKNRKSIIALCAAVIILIVSLVLIKFNTLNKSAPVIPNTNILLNMQQEEIKKELGDSDKTFEVDGNLFEEYNGVLIGSENYTLVLRYNGKTKKLNEIDCVTNINANKDEICKLFYDYYTEKGYTVNKENNKDDISYNVNNKFTLRVYPFEDNLHITIDKIM